MSMKTALALLAFFVAAAHCAGHALAEQRLSIRAVSAAARIDGKLRTAFLMTDERLATLHSAPVKEVN